MKLLLDYLAIVDALGGTPSWSFGSTAGGAEDASYPASNLWDATTPRNGYALSRYARATYAANADTVTYTTALGATYANISTMIVSGFVDESARALGLQSGNLGVGAAASSGLTSLVFKDSAGTAKKTLTTAAGSYWCNTTTPTVVLRSAAAFNDTGAKLTITASAAGATRIGYIGVYGDVATIDPAGVSVQASAGSTMGMTEAGAPWSFTRPEARTMTLAYSFLDQSAREIIEQLTRDSVTGGLGTIDPRAYPVLAIYVDELDTGTAEGSIACNLQSGMYMLDESVTYQFNSGAKLRPNAALTFRRWA